MKLHKSHRLFAKIAYSLGYISAEKLDRVIFESKKAPCSQTLQHSLDPDSWNKVRLIYLEKIIAQMLVQYQYITNEEYEKIMAIEMKNAHKNKKIWEPIILSQGIITADMEHCFLKSFSKRGGDVPGLVDENLLAAKKHTFLPEEYDSSLLCVGDYLVEKSLGKRTHKARHQKLGKEFVLKLFHFQKQKELPTAIRLFSQRMKVIRKLRHKNILPVHDIGIVDEKHYIVIPYIVGNSLHDELTKVSKFTPHQSIAIVLRIAETISIAHRNHVIHETLTPKNIIIDDSGNPYIKDFAIASLEKHLIPNSNKITSHTSPQQIYNDKIDKQNDIYSLGITLFEMLTGTQPFFSNSLLWKKYKILMHQVSWKNHMVPKEIKTICYRATAKRKRHRYADGAEMSSDIRRYLNKQPLMKKYSSILFICENYLRKFFIYFAVGILIVCSTATFHLHKNRTSYNNFIQIKATLVQNSKKIQKEKSRLRKIKKFHKLINDYKILMHTHKNGAILIKDYTNLLKKFYSLAKKTNPELAKYVQHLLKNAH